MFNSRYFKVVLFGSVAGVGALIWRESTRQSTYRKEDYYQKSVLLLQKYEPGAEFLGRPIYSGRIQFGDERKTKIDELTARLSVPVKGSKDRGTLHIKASRENNLDKWDINELDLEISSTKQRWKFYDRNMKKQYPESEITVEEVVSLPT